MISTSGTSPPLHRSGDRGAAGQPRGRGAKKWGGGQGRRASCTPLSPRGLGLVPPAASSPPKPLRGCVGDWGVPALGGWHTGTPPQLPPVPPPLHPLLPAGRVLLPSPGRAQPSQAALGTPGTGTRGEGRRDGGSAVATRWDRDRGGDQDGAVPPLTPPPLTLVPHGHPPAHPGLYPPVTVATSRRGTGSAWGRAASGEAGPGGRQRAGGHWPGEVSCGTAVSSLAGVTWGSRLPWGDAPSSLPPRRGAGRRQSPCSGWYLGRRSC